MNDRRRSGMVAALLSLCSIVSFTEPARAQTASPAGVANPLAAPSLDRLSATRERPLFAPSRRAAPLPPPVASAAPVESAASPPQIALLGVIIAVEGPRAVINDVTRNKIARVRIGDEIDGWKVHQIDERLLVLWRDGRSASFKLFNGERVKPSGQTLNAANNPPENAKPSPHRRRTE
jgi:hypothetical protein